MISHCTYPLQKCVVRLIQRMNPLSCLDTTVKERSEMTKHRVKDHIGHDRIDYIEDKHLEVIWTRMRLKRLPRQYACIIMSCIYHPADTEIASMRDVVQVAYSA